MVRSGRWRLEPMPIIAVRGDPTAQIESIRDVRFVMADGRIFKNDITHQKFSWEWNF